MSDVNMHDKLCPLSASCAEYPNEPHSIITSIAGGKILVKPLCEVCMAECQCDLLRACEQRVIAEGDEQSRIAYATGYRNALDLVEVAIKNLPRLTRFMDDSELVDLPDIMTVITTMREVK